MATSRTRMQVEANKEFLINFLASFCERLPTAMECEAWSSGWSSRSGRKP